MDQPEWPSWLTQDRLAELEAAARDVSWRPLGGECPCCYRFACECPDAAVGLAVLLAERRESCRDS